MSSEQVADGTNKKRWLLAKEAANGLGISVTTFWTRVNEGLIEGKSLGPGSRKMYDREELCKLPGWIGE